MDVVAPFWAGAMRFAGGLDLPALAAAHGGWEALAAAGEGALVAAGVAEARARAWLGSAPLRTRGRVVTLADPAYPAALRRTRTPPPVLLVEGEVGVLSRPAVAVVGTRACTAYGRGVARHLAASLAQAGVVVVSGLARGVDGEAHTATLGLAPTVAVVGHGLGTTAPASHGALRTRIVAAGGAIVSTWADDEPPRAWHFPERNAWIAGLAEIVVVVEAPSRSGALITARAALAEGREVAAVPGPLGAPASAGCLELLEDGARVVADVARFVASVSPAAPPPADAWLAELFAGVDLDTIARRRGRSVTDVLAEVARLEVDGRVVRVPGGRYAMGGRPA